MKGLFIPGITAEMFRNGCLESIEALMAEGEIYDIDYTRWIPVSERLPEKAEARYWICTDGGYQCQCRWTNNVYGLGEGDRWAWKIFDIPQYSKVVAWMPLPKPYKTETKIEQGLNFVDQDTMMSAT